MKHIHTYLSLVQETLGKCEPLIQLLKKQKDKGKYYAGRMDMVGISMCLQPFVLPPQWCWRLTDCSRDTLPHGKESRYLPIYCVCSYPSFKSKLSKPSEERVCVSGKCGKQRGKKIHIDRE